MTQVKPEATATAIATVAITDQQEIRWILHATTVRQFEASLRLLNALQNMADEDSEEEQASREAIVALQRLLRSTTRFPARRDKSRPAARPDSRERQLPPGDR